MQRAPDPIVFGKKAMLTTKPNVPYDVGASILFDTASVHPILRDSSLAWGYWDKFAKWTAWVATGTQLGYDQWIGGVSPERYHTSKCKSPRLHVVSFSETYLLVKCSSTSQPMASHTSVHHTALPNLLSSTRSEQASLMSPPSTPRAVRSTWLPGLSTLTLTALCTLLRAVGLKPSE